MYMIRIVESQKLVIAAIYPGATNPSMPMINKTYLKHQPIYYGNWILPAQPNILYKRQS